MVSTKALAEAFNTNDADAPLKATALATTVLVLKHILTVAVQVKQKAPPSLCSSVGPGDAGRPSSSVINQSFGLLDRSKHPPPPQHPNPTTTPQHPTPPDQGGARFESGKRPPEDAPLMPKAGAQDFTGTAKAAGKGEESKALKAAIEVGGG